MLLNISDVLQFVPVEQAELAIIQAQTLVESYLGANRPLAKRKHIEILNVPDNRRILLSRLPVWKDNTIKVQLENTHGEWFDLATSEYVADFDYAEITITSSLSSHFTLYPGIPGANSGYQQYRRPFTRQRKSRAKVSYTTGFDFDADLADNEHLEGIQESIKSALLAVVAYQQSQDAQGIKRFELKEHYEVEYQNNLFSIPSGKGNNRVVNYQLENLLAVFKSLKDRQFTT